MASGEWSSFECNRCRELAAQVRYSSWEQGARREVGRGGGTCQKKFLPLTLKVRDSPYAAPGVVYGPPVVSISKSTYFTPISSNSSIMQARRTRKNDGLRRTADGRVGWRKPGGHW